jgi:Rod binding domain-containing protein
MDVTLSAGAMAPIPGGDLVAKPKTAPEAAQQFEALLLGQMLQAAHTADGEQDSSSETMWDMAAQQFAQVLAKNGGVGMARMVEKGLKVSDLEPKR